MKKQYKIFGLILALALLVGATFAVASFSASAADSLAIEYANVAYNKMTQLAFTIKGTPAQGTTIGLAYWDFNVTGEKTLANATVTFETGTLQGKTYWLTPGIPASEMSEKITVAPVTRDANNNVALAGALFEYSIYDYVKDRLADNNVTDSQMKLYTNLVKYGNAAEKRINGSINIPYFVAENGEINNTGKGLALANEGDKLLLRAKTINADGDYFLYWTAPDGSKIYDRVANVTAGASNTTYTANYGAKADSAYSDALNFNNYSTGPLNLVPPKAAISTSGTDYYVTGETSHLDGATTVKGYTKVNAADDATVVLGDTLSVKSENGKNYLSFEKNYIKSGLTGARVVFNNTGARIEDRIDIELRFNNAGWFGMDFHLYFTDGTSAKENHPSGSFNSNGDLVINKVTAGNFKVGETIALTFQIVEAGVDVYVNGTYATTINNGQSADYNNAAAFRGLGITGNSGYDFDVDFLTVNFVNTDMFN